MAGESINKLSSDLENLKTVLRQPRIWLSNYVSELKNTIDIEFTKFLIEGKPEEDAKHGTKRYEQIIEKIENYEKNCFTNLRTDKIDDQVQEQAEASINEIEYKISNLNTFNNEIEKNLDLDLIDSLIYETLLKIQLSIVLNNGLIFLASSTIKNAIGLFGTLFIVEGQFFGERAIKMIE